MPRHIRSSRPALVAAARMAAVCVLTLAAFTRSPAHPEDWGALVREDRAAARPWPVLSAFEPAAAQPAYAYAVQRSLAGPSLPWVAWRALFASPLVASQFRVSAPAYARLGQDLHLLRPPYVIRSAAWQRPVVELGLAARLAALPPRFPVSPEALEPLVLGWSAMLVVADVGFAPGAAPTREDYIAVNGGSEAFMTGPVLRATEADPASLRVSLALAGRQVTWGRADELPGGPLHALARLLNGLAAARERVNDQQLFFTGALGRATALAPGRYVADFGAFGRIEFESRRITTRSAPVRP